MTLMVLMSSCVVKLPGLIFELLLTNSIAGLQEQHAPGKAAGLQHLGQKLPVNVTLLPLLSLLLMKNHHLGGLITAGHQQHTSMPITHVEHGQCTQVMAIVVKIPGGTGRHHLAGHSLLAALTRAKVRNDLTVNRLDQNNMTITVAGTGECHVP